MLLENPWDNASHLTTTPATWKDALGNMLCLSRILLKLFPFLAATAIRWSVLMSRDRLWPRTLCWSASNEKEVQNLENGECWVSHASNHESGEYNKTHQGHQKMGTCASSGQAIYPWLRVKRATVPPNHLSSILLQYHTTRITHPKWWNIFSISNHKSLIMEGRTSPSIQHTDLTNLHHIFTYIIHKLFQRLHPLQWCLTWAAPTGSM